MNEVQVKIINKLGLHARAAAKLVALAGEFESEVRLARGDNAIDASSIMAVMMLAAGQGTELSLRADGPDEDDAIERISALIADYFGEGE